MNINAIGTWLQQFARAHQAESISGLTVSPASKLGPVRRPVAYLKPAEDGTADMANLVSMANHDALDGRSSVEPGAFCSGHLKGATTSESKLDVDYRVAPARSRKQ
jgi:hypothetical protein